jgi:hypothetical protein
MKRTTLSALFAISTLTFAGTASATEVCAYVTGSVNGGTVATPAIIITTPNVSAVTTPVRVAVDATNHDIIGYKLAAPGQEVNVPGQSLFIPAETAEIPSYAVHLDDLNIGQHRCVNVGGVHTPAIPIYVPPSYLQIPGVSTDTPGATVTVANRQITVPAKNVSIPSTTIVVPAIEQTVPPIDVEIPDQTVTVNFVVPWVVPYLAPLGVDGNNPPSP